jgi:hypothetical protein
MRESVESLQTETAIRDVPNRLVTQNKAAALARVSRRVIAGLIEDGRLATIQVASRRWVIGRSLDDLIRDLDGSART